MTARSGRSASRPLANDRAKSRSANPRAESREWELADELLDEALRHTFPASDALSIVQNVRGPSWRKA
jgi:hypothetical protein